MSDPHIEWQFTTRAGSGVDPGARIGPYEVVSRLGAGGMGTVFRVRDPLGRPLALKLLSAARPTARGRARFLREGQVTAALDHPGIVVVHDAGEDHGHLYLVYELVEGRDLGQRFEELDRGALLEVIGGVADALGHAHARGVIHRDLKPENILIDEAGRARVADFGLAQAIGLERLTLSGALLGTPRAMAPEQVTGDRDRYGPPTDVWALGLLLYRALTGREAFEATGTLPELASRLIAARFPAPRKVASDVDPRLEQACLRALSPRPEDRQPDGAAFAADLRAALAGGAARGGRRVWPGAALAGVAGVGLALWLAPPGEPAASASGPSPAADPSAAPPRPPPARPPAEPDPPAEVAARRRELVARVQAALDERAADARVVAGLRELVGVGEPARDAAEARLGDAVAARAIAGLEAEDPERAVRLLSALADTGGRIADPRLGTKMMIVAMMKAAVDMPDRLYWYLFKDALRLDVPSTARALEVSGQSLRPETKPWSDSPRDPWARFADLWVELDRGGAAERSAAVQGMRAVLAGDEPALGPRQWGDVAAEIARYLPPEEALSLLEEAERRDPESYAVHGSFATALREREPERALARNERAVALCGRRFAEEFQGMELRWLLRDRLAIEIDLDRRADARRTFARVRRLAPEKSSEFAERHPWLREDGDE